MMICRCRSSDRLSHGATQAPTSLCARLSMNFRPGSPDAGGGLRRKSHSHVWRVSEWYTSSRQRRGPPMCVSSKLPSSLIEYPLCPLDDTCNSTHAARHSKFQKLDAPRTVDRLGSRRLKETQIRISILQPFLRVLQRKRGSCDPSRKPASPEAQHPEG